MGRKCIVDGMRIKRNLKILEGNISGFGRQATLYTPALIH